MAKPILLLSPEESNIATGTITSTSPILTGDATSTLVAGRFGQAWRINRASGWAQFGFTELPTDEAFTVFLRLRSANEWALTFDGYGAETGGELYLHGYEDNSAIYSYFHNAVDGSDWHDREWESNGWSGGVTLAITITPTSFTVFENGERKTVYEWVGAEEPDPPVNLPGLFQPGRVYFDHTLDLESVLIFNEVLDETEIKHLTDMEERWTWENTSDVVPTAPSPLKRPVLIVSPEQTRSKYSSPTPVLLGSTTVVTGEFGQAWRMLEERGLSLSHTPLKTTEALTILARIKVGANPSISFSQSGTTQPHQVWLQYTNTAGFFTSYRNTEVTGGQLRWNVPEPSQWQTVALSYTSSSLVAYLNGQPVTTFEIVAGQPVPIDTVYFPNLIQPDTITMWGPSDVESVLIFNEVLTAAEIQQLTGMQERWTWENTQLEEIPQQRTTASVSGSTRIIPSLYKVTRNNEFIEDLTPLILKGRVSFDPDRSIKWDFEAEVIDNGSIVPYVDYIAPYLTVEYEDGHKETSQFGIYTTVPPKQTITQTGRSMSLDSRDLTWLLAQAVTENGYSRGGTYNVVTTIRALLDGWGYTRHSIPDHPATFGKTTSWKAGTSRLTIINDMLNLIGYYTLYMTKDGYLASMPYVADKDKAVSVTYDTTVPSRVKVLRSITRDTTPDRIANKIVVIGGSNSDTPIVATAVNNSPSSPTSSATLGMVITKVYEGVQVSDQATADKMAQRYLDIASQEYHRMTLTTSHDLSVEPYAVYRLNIKSKTGESVATGVWNTRGWSIGFTPTEVMTHELSNIDDPAMEMGV